MEHIRIMNVSPSSRLQYTTLDAEPLKKYRKKSTGEIIEGYPIPPTENNKLAVKSIVGENHPLYQQLVRGTLRGSKKTHHLVCADKKEKLFT